jgi:predicted DNA-binding transcriptional regulator AlpA
MLGTENKNLVSSKEILRVTGISRATLNNYIKMGIIPRPLVGKPKSGMKGVKKIGYFPKAVLERIESVKRLKREGSYMEEIARKFKGTPISGPQEEVREVARRPQKEGVSVAAGLPVNVYDQELRVTFEQVTFPSYLVNYNFEIEWINPKGEVEIFQQPVRRIMNLESRNIFKLLFNWDFHSRVKNWKDVVSFHMSFAKNKFSKTWIERLYTGISAREISVLEEIYDKVSAFPKHCVRDTHLNLLLIDGTTASYRVYSIFFKEGMFFNFAPAGTSFFVGEPSLNSDFDGGTTSPTDRF